MDLSKSPASCVKVGLESSFSIVLMGEKIWRVLPSMEPGSDASSFRVSFYFSISLVLELLFCRSPLEAECSFWEPRGALIVEA